MTTQTADASQDRVVIFDTTLRDGEQCPGATMTHEEKLGAVAGFIIDSYRYDPDLMKVIIVEVTRAANSFGRTHLEEINRAYELIGRIVADGQKNSIFREDIDPAFAAMVFYGAIEQLLSGWIFGVIPGSDRDFDEARALIVKTICEGLARR